MKNFNKTNIITAWVLFLISLTVYLLSLEPTVSLWDCGEFIASAYKLQIGHPPGAPIYMLIARFFSLFAGNSTEKVALMVNSMSAFASAFTIMFLYWSIVHLISKLYANLISPEQKELQLSQKLVIVGGGITGSLAYAFTDTFWFSAVESEVYALSSLFTAIVFWAILKWENEANEKQSNRWIILIAYLMGLSIGVHLLNLLAIPAIVMVYYFKKHVPGTSGIIKALLVSALILGGIMYVIIPGFIWIAAKFELIFVNGLGLPYKSGVLFYLFILITALAYGLWRTSKNKKVVANTILLAITVILIGYSSFSLIVIRSMANPPMNENNPQNVFSLLSYLNREQYGNRPLFSGQYFNAKAIGIKEGKSIYSQIDGKYVVTNNALSYKYDPEYITVFPRMWNSDNNHIDVYINWSGLSENQLYEPQRDANGNIIRDSSGKIIYDRSLPRNPPGLFNNLRFFFSYQLGHMYLRYFMWNFSGRQNDIQADGGPLYGNWISGLDIFDKSRTGSMKNMPDDIKNIPSRNTYYLIPLILGIAGMIFQYKRDIKNFWVVGLLFILTGIAIVVYLNQTPLQPRERDYAYAGSFYAFSIWIGMAVPAIFNFLKTKYQNKNTAFITGIICILIAPGVLAVNNYDDHNRSGRYTTRDIAYNYLITCAPNAILFTNGDNDTFPLWYAQEVEGIRTDVRVVNLMLLNMDWYIDQMKRKVYDSDPLPISLETNQYRNGTRDRVYIQQVTSQTAVLNDIMEFIASDNMQTKVKATTGDFFDYIPTRNLSIPVDTSVIFNNGTVKRTDSLEVLTSIDWTINSGSLGKSELIVLDILANNNWERPVYFASLGHSGTLGLEDYMQLEGLAYRLVPIYSPTPGNYEAGRINSEILYDNLMNNFLYGNMNNPDVYIDDFHQKTLMIIRLRTRFSQLAETLINEGDTLRAVEVLDRCMVLTPHDKLPWDYSVLPLAELYYRSDKTEKANEILKGLSEITNSRMDYYLMQNTNFILRIKNELIYNLQVMNNIIAIYYNNGQNELAKQIEDKYSTYYEKYSSLQSVE